MKHKTLDATQLRNMLLAGATTLGMHIQEVNSLNVFPVPDGDTGTNMNLTVESASREISKEGMDSVAKIAEAVSMGSLMGARGNSGVILSQLFRGLAKRLSATEKVTPQIFAEALQEGVTTAYKAVIRPVEGTILTVAKDSAKQALRTSRTAADINTVLAAVLEEARASLKRTPDLLPVLKQAGVVDAGGKGLVYIFEGWMAFLEGRAADVVVEQPSAKVGHADHQQEDLEYLYCTEFMITGKDLDEQWFRRQLDKMGGSLLVVGTTGLIKVHVHTNNPGDILELALSKGEELQDIKIENMRLQHTEVAASNQTEPVPAPEMEAVQQAAPEKEMGAVAVAPGPGLEEIFLSMGVDVVILGGQTMNPSTEDFLKAMEEVKARQIILLPNNSNIILAASQAAELSDRPVSVVPTKSIPQGLSALLEYDPDGNGLEEMAKAMEQSSAAVQSGQVTFAVRDSVFENQEISEGDILGIANGSIMVVGNDVTDTLLELVEKMLQDDSEIITLFYGEDVSQEDAEKVVDVLAQRYDDLEVELHSGGQPLYYYIISVE